MDVLIKGKNIEVTEEARQYAWRKIGKLDHYLPNITEAYVDVSRELTKSAGTRYVAQVTVNSNGTLLRGEERAGDLFAAIDAVADVMHRQIERYKGRLYWKGRVAATSISKAPASPTPAGESLAAQDTTLPERVVKVKRFSLKPMSPAEALEQMELLGHDFFLFLNATNNTYCVLYRRRDGDYGLIEPELA